MGVMEKPQGSLRAPGEGEALSREDALMINELSPNRRGGAARCWIGWAVLQLPITTTQHTPLHPRTSRTVHPAPSPSKASSLTFLTSHACPGLYLRPTTIDQLADLHPDLVLASMDINFQSHQSPQVR